MSSNIVLLLSGDASKIAPPKMYALIVKNGEADTTINYHVINVTKNETTIHAIVTPLNPENLFEVMLQYEDYPNDTHHLDVATIPHEDTEEEGNCTHKEMRRHTYFPDPTITAQAGIYRVGIRIRSELYMPTINKYFYIYACTLCLQKCTSINIVMPKLIIDFAFSVQICLQINKSKTGFLSHKRLYYFTTTSKVGNHNTQGKILFL